MKKNNALERKFPAFSPLAVFSLWAVLQFLIFTLVYTMIGVFPFGDKFLLHSDAFSQYYPFLSELRRKLFSGESLFYSFSGGLGYNFLATIAYYAASPFNLLLLFVPENLVGDYTAWMMVVKVSLCGGVFSWYLYNQKRDYPFFAVAFGIMYACSGFLIGQKFNLMWLDSIALVPLVMLGLEKIVRRESPTLYLLSLFFVIWCNYYIGFIVCLFSCFYLVFLLFLDESFFLRKFLHILSSFVFSSLLAGGMASVLLVPSLFALRVTRAVVEGESPGFRFYNNFICMLRAHYMETGFIRSSRNPGDVVLYCGVIVLFLVPLFFTEKKIPKKARIGYGIFLGFLLLSFTFSPLNFFWHGFHNQNSVPNRFAFLYVLLLLKLCYAILPMLKDIEESRLNKIILGVFSISAVFFVWDLVGQHEFRVSLSFAFLMLYTVLLYEIRSSKKKDSIKIYSLVLCVLLVIEAGSAVLIDTSINGEGMTRSDVMSWQSAYHQLIDKQDSPSFYRSEADFDEYNFVTLLGGNAVSLFNSTMQDNVTKFLRQTNIHTELNAILCRTPPSLMADLLGIRYFITQNTSSPTWNGYERVGFADDKTLYENKNALSLGLMVPEKISSWWPDIGDGMEGLNSLSGLLADVEALYTFREVYSGESGEPVSFDLSEGETLYVTIDNENLYEVSWNTPEYSNLYETQLPNLLLAANCTPTDHTAVLTVTTTDGSPYTGKVFICREEDYIRVLDALSANQLENVSVSGNHVTGSISTDQTGILLMTIPYNEGWQVTVDGAPSSYEEIGGALIGIPLKEGPHQIEMRYIPQGFATGCVMSLLFLLLTGVYIFWQHKTRSPKSE